MHPMNNKHIIELPSEYETAVNKWQMQHPKNPPTTIPFRPTFWKSLMEAIGPTKAKIPIIPEESPGDIV
jgi:hypothetical protein